MYPPSYPHSTTTMPTNNQRLLWLPRSLLILTCINFIIYTPAVGVAEEHGEQVLTCWAVAFTEDQDKAMSWAE